jgi:hypothetical protein
MFSDTRLLFVPNAAFSSSLLPLLYRSPVKREVNQSFHDWFLSKYSIVAAFEEHRKFNIGSFTSVARTLIHNTSSCSSSVQSGRLRTDSTVYPVIIIFYPGGDLLFSILGYASSFTR